MSQRTWRSYVVIGGGFVLSVFCLWLSIRQVDAQGLKAAFTAINYLPVMMCAGALCLGLVFRAMRWRVVASFSASEQQKFSHATNLGVLANLIFPGRAGEFVRVITLAKITKSSLPRPLASAVIDRLLDIFVLLASAIGLWCILPVNELLGKWIAAIAFLGCIATAFVVYYGKSAGAADDFIAQIVKRWLRRWKLQPEVFLAELRSELRQIAGGWLSFRVFALVVLVLCADYAAVAFILRAFNLALPVEAPLLLWLFLAAGSALPSAPGYVGVYQAAAVWALSFFSVAAPTSVAVATLLQVATLAVVLVMAGPGAWGIISNLVRNRRVSSQE